MRKFSIVIPCLIARGIRRLLENEEGGVPNIEQMCYNCGKVLDSIYTVYFADGYIIPELADRSADRCIHDGTGKHGGVRVNCAADEGQWLNPRALHAKMEKQAGIITDVADNDLVDSDASSCGICKTSYASQYLEVCDISYCSAD